MEGIECCRIEHGSNEWNETVELRRKILRTPLGLTFSDSQLEAEKDCIHLAAFGAGKVVGTLLLEPAKEGMVKMRQVAVDPEHQGKHD